MKADAAFAALHDANPVPDAQSFASDDPTVLVFLSSTKERSERMGTLEVETFPLRKPPPAHRWQPLTAAAVFVIVVALGVAVVLAGRMSFDTVDIPLPPYETPEAAAEAYLAALVAGDHDAYRAMFAPDGTDWSLSAGKLVIDDEHIRARFLYTSAIFESIDEVECETIAANGVECRFVVTDSLQRRIGGDSTIIARQSFTTGDMGLLRSVSGPNMLLSAEQRDEFDRFHEWNEANHPAVHLELDDLWMSDPLDTPIEDTMRRLLDAADEYGANQQG